MTLPGPGFGHHGVLGMHWGQHTAALMPSAKSVRNAGVETTRAVGRAAIKTGRASVKIASFANQHKGAIAAGVVTVAVLHDVGKYGYEAAIFGVANKAAHNREAGRQALKALPSAATQLKYAKMVRGAYKITTL